MRRLVVLFLVFLGILVPIACDFNVVDTSQCRDTEPSCIISCESSVPMQARCDNGKWVCDGADPNTCPCKGSRQVCYQCNDAGGGYLQRQQICNGSAWVCPPGWATSPPSYYCADASTTCAPAAPATPLGTLHAVGAPKDACTPVEIDDYYFACIVGTATNCSSYISSHSKCATCLETAYTYSVWSAVVVYGSKRYINTAGCILLVTGDGSPSGCAAAYAKLDECHRSSCGACAANQYFNCQDQSDVYYCASYTSPAACKSEAGADAGPLTQCTGPASQVFEGIGAMFCAAGG